MAVTLLVPEQRWECALPDCPVTDVTREARPHSRFHACRSASMRGLLSVPLVPAGTRCTVRAVERADYVAGELVQTDATGRPVMAVETVRDDGTDLAVLAPCAQADLRG